MCLGHPYLLVYNVDITRMPNPSLKTSIKLTKLLL
uniref:Uncharacterized protein n=1 Tax=Rhizophora mucronata TaxID=61149 RepID=A0A2P2P3V0_RHIMU